MPEQTTPHEPVSRPDHFLLGDVWRADQPKTTEYRLADGGPRYRETPSDPTLPSIGVAEPWNTVTAMLFIVIVIGWALRLRGRYRAYPFVSCCLPILLAGGIGGTLYHAYRTRLAYFLLDVVPIQILGLAGSIYLTTRLFRGAKLRRVLVMSVGLLIVFIALYLERQRLIFSLAE